VAVGAPLSGPAHVATANATGSRTAGIAFLTENKSIAGSSAEFQRIRADGANTVSFDVWWHAPSYSTSTLAPSPATDSDADLSAATQEAQQAGLSVTLTLKFEVGNGGWRNGWRGKYNPPDPATFFSSYRTMVDHYADLAQRTRMSMLFVGSEMVMADGYVDEWHQMIASARQHYSGPVSYEQDWREVGRFSFGDALDVVSISGYFPISDEERPSLAQLKAGWHSYTAPGQSQVYDAFSAVEGQAQRWGKPVIFGETGYMATTYPGQNPCCNDAHPADANLQYLAYKALLDTFVGQPWWGGAVWWAWNDGDLRTPAGKPAESLISANALVYPSRVGSPPTDGSARGDGSHLAGRSSMTGSADPASGGNPSSPASAPPPSPGLPGTDTQIAGAPAGTGAGQVGIQLPAASGAHRHGTTVVVGAVLLAVALAALATVSARSSMRRRRVG
jgi:hypothetical protein